MQARRLAIYTHLASLAVAFAAATIGLVTSTPVWAQLEPPNAWKLPSTSGCGGIAGSTGWFSTDLFFDAGDPVSICAAGHIQLNTMSGNLTGPEGEAGGAAGAGFCAPEAAEGALLASLGGQIIEVGSSWTGTAPNSGTLFLGVNDEFYSDNAGEFWVTASANKELYFNVAGVSTGADFAIGLGHWDETNEVHRFHPVSPTDPFSAMVTGLAPEADSPTIEDAMISAVNGLGLGACVVMYRVPPPGVHEGRIRLAGPFNNLFLTGPGQTTSFACNLHQPDAPVPGTPAVSGCSFNPVAYDASLLPVPSASNVGLAVLVALLCLFFLLIGRSQTRPS